jgi:two-component system NtrC family sensor kinase
MFWDITDRLKAERDRTHMEVQLRHAQKMESIGQLAAGIAHEINTPTQYVGDNIRFLEPEAFTNLVPRPARINRAHCMPRPASAASGTDLLARVDADLQRLDLPNICSRELPTPRSSRPCMASVASRSIVRAMKEFSHPGTEEKAPVDLHRAIENTVTVARNEWKYVADMVTSIRPELPAGPVRGR